MGRAVLIAILASCLLSSCTEEIKPGTDETGTNFYPLQVGDYWIYQVTETRYRNQFDTQPGDSVTYYVRERIDTTYKDLTNENTYMFIRSRRNSLTAEWSTDSVFVVNKSRSDVRINRNNVRRVSFIFPVQEGKKWNADIFNTNSSVFNKAEEGFYAFAGKGQPFIVNDTTYRNTVKVIQHVNENAIERQDQYEVYAYGVGRIFKQVLSFDYCADPTRQNACEVGKGFIINGIRRTEKLQAYGSAK